MKKVVALLAVVLLPIFASAYQEELAEMTGKIGDTITQGVVKVDTENQENSRQGKIKQVKKILKDAKHRMTTSSWGVSGGTAGGSASIDYTRRHYYDIDQIKENLKAAELDVFLKNDRAALEEVANYVTDHTYYIFTNDYAALLAIGLDYIDAAIRTKNDDYVQITTENVEYVGDIISINYYGNFYSENFVSANGMSGNLNYNGKKETVLIGNFTPAQEENLTIIGTHVIVRVVDQQLINLLVPQKQQRQRVSFWNIINDPEYGKEVGKDVTSFINNK